MIHTSAQIMLALALVEILLLLVMVRRHVTLITCKTMCTPITKSALMEAL